MFSGDQLVIVGRYKTPGNAKVVVSGAVHGKVQKFDFPAKLVANSPDETNGFVEKLWAVRRVGELLDEIDLKGKNDELVKELVELSLRHGIITPYTSFFADENTNIQSVRENTRRPGDRLGAAPPDWTAWVGSYNASTSNSFKAPSRTGADKECPCQDV